MHLDWQYPWSLAAFLPVTALLWWFHLRSLRPMGEGRRRALFAVRCLLVLIALLAAAGPAWERASDDEAVIVVLDHSRSQGESGLRTARERTQQLLDGLPAGVPVGIVSAGRTPTVHRAPSSDRTLPEIDARLLEEDGGQTDLAAAVSLAGGLYPAGTARRMVLVGDGQQTRGDLEAAARDAALRGIVIDAIPVAGEPRPDVQVARLTPSRPWLHEGASLELTAEIESSLAGTGTLRLFENGIEVEAREVEFEVGKPLRETFRRTPDRRNMYTYRVRAEGVEGDAIAENDEAMALVDVRGRPLLLYVEGEPGEARHLADAMEQEGIRLQVRPPDAFPQTLQDLSAYDGVVLSDVPAHALGDRSMALVRDYVEQLGGGFLMIGGKNSFGVGGYYRTPIEDILPVKMKAPDTEERYATALGLVIDRSGSMSGQKLELCKSAAIATVDLLSDKDYICVVAFDSAAHDVVPVTRATSKESITGRIAAISSDGGTNIYPGMISARGQLATVKAKVKHMIVLTDGQSEGADYAGLAAQLKASGVTVSAVAVGSGADTNLLQQIAAAGGGKFYFSADATNVPRIFTQDAMVHMGRLIREEAFAPKQAERHPMLKGLPVGEAPTLLGYVKTNRKATAQVPLVTDLGDPLLANWQFGLGKVTAFTSDCKSRWAALWITGWPGYGQFWAQVLRETARKPQSDHMELRHEETPQGASVRVDLMEDAATFENDAEVTADVFFVAAGSLGSSMQEFDRLRLEQTGPGRYEANYAPEEPGVYLVRARSGAQVVSAGLVHNVSGETATGRVDRDLLAKVCELTGGTLLDSAAAELPPLRATQTNYAELTPALLRLFLLVFLADLLIRRWENVLGMLSLFERGRASS